MFDGVVVTEPFLLYHDEISVGTTSTSGVLTCMTESNTPIWRNVHRTELSSSSSPLKSTRTGPEIRRLSRTGDPIPNDDEYNGLWSCKQQGKKTRDFIAIYNRGEGKNVYTIAAQVEEITGK